MSLEIFGGFLLLLVLAGFVWHRHNVQLAAALFGDDYRIRYVQGRWVLEGTINDLRIRYATGGIGFFPALSYLLLETSVSESFAVTPEDSVAVPDAEIEATASLRNREGFRRLDGLLAGSAPIAASGRISWLHAGEGLLLRRYSKRGGDAAFVLEDIRLLQALAASINR